MADPSQIDTFTHEHLIHADIPVSYLELEAEILREDPDFYHRILEIAKMDPRSKEPGWNRGLRVGLILVHAVKTRAIEAEALEQMFHRDEEPPTAA